VVRMILKKDEGQIWSLILHFKFYKYAMVRKKIKDYICQSFLLLQLNCKEI